MTLGGSMRVLVTGADGFVGGYMVAQLLRESNLEIHATYRNKLANELLLSGEDRIHLYEADVRDTRRMTELFRRVLPERVIHLAGRAFIPDSFADPTQTYEANVLGTVSVLEGARDVQRLTGVSPEVLLAGAGQIYDAERSGATPLDEEAIIHPVTPYTTSKACAELVAEDYRRNFGVRVIIMRPFNHIGPRQHERFACSDYARRVALVVCGKLEPVFETGNMDIQRDFTDVRDVVRAYWMLFGRQSKHYVFNVCSGVGTRIQEVLDILQNIAGVTVKTIIDPARFRPNDLPVIVGNFTRLHEATGWKPTIPLRQTLTDMYHYWLESIRRQA